VSQIPVSYLSLRAPPCCDRALPAGLEVRVERLPLQSYLEIYNAVGGPWGWDQRHRMPQEALDRHLRSEACRIYVLRPIATPEVTMGFCEFDLVDRIKPQLMNFGLQRQYFSRGLGLPLLCHALRDVWSLSNPQLVWLHTDSMDHPRAMQTYRDAGFELERVEMMTVYDL
jgi:hypothetical protein